MARSTRRSAQAAAAASASNNDDTDTNAVASSSASTVPLPLPPATPAAVPPPPQAPLSPTARRGLRRKPAVPAPPIPRAQSPSPFDHLTPLSAELLALILFHLSPPDQPDPKSLYHLALVNRGLLPHVRSHMYRDLRIETRVHAHAMHRTLHGSEINKSVKSITADVGQMAKTSSQWIGWFLFHSMHSLCGIIGSCRTLLSLNLSFPTEATAWTQSLCQSLIDLKMLHTLVKDLDRSDPIDPVTGTVKEGGKKGAGHLEGMDVGWHARKTPSVWSVSQLMKPLASLKSLHTLRLCGISSDSSTSPPTSPHGCRLTEVVLIEVNITNTDLIHLLGNAQTLKKLTLWRSSLLSKRGLTHVLKRCPNLVELRIGGSWFGAKDEDDTNFPLDLSISHLPHLRILHVSGHLISPKILLNPSTNLTHLLVSCCSTFTPQSIHSALAQMRNDPPPVERLTLPEMGREVNGGVGTARGESTEWSDTWKFTVKATAEAKGVRLDTGERVTLNLDSDSE